MYIVVTCTCIYMCMYVHYMYQLRHCGTAYTCIQAFKCLSKRGFQQTGFQLFVQCVEYAGFQVSALALCAVLYMYMYMYVCLCVCIGVMAQCEPT